MCIDIIKFKKILKPYSFDATVIAPEYLNHMATFKRKKKYLNCDNLPRIDSMTVALEKTQK